MTRMTMFNVGLLPEKMGTEFLALSPVNIFWFETSDTSQQNKPYSINIQIRE